MTDANKEVDLNALNEVIHAWMKASPTLSSSDFATRYSEAYGLVRLLQARCEEMDWRLTYERTGNAPTRNGGEWYTVQVQLPKLGARIERAAHTLPLAICRAIEAAIEELKPEPETRLHITLGSGGYVQCKRSGMDGPHTILIRGVRDECGGDGVQFCCGPSVHITDIGQLRDIAQWLNTMADGIKNDKSPF